MLEVLHTDFKGCCIYCFQNLDNGKVYIGQTVNYNYRIKKHLYLLKRGKHWNKHLQESFNKGQSFEVFPFELCERKLMSEREVVWISFFDSTDNEKGYNKSKGGEYDYSSTIKGKTLSSKGRKQSEDHIKNRITSQTGKKHPFSKEGLQRIKVFREGRRGLRQNGKKVTITDKTTGALTTFNSKREVEDFLGIPRDTLIYKFYYGKPRQILKKIEYNNLIIER